MILDLQKGMSLNLSKIESNLTEICIGVNWGMISHKVLKTFKEGSFLGFGGTKVEKEVIEKESVDLDASAILYDSNNQVIESSKVTQEQFKKTVKTVNQKGLDESENNKCKKGGL